jgi:hypothetical protein
MVTLSVLLALLEPPDDERGRGRRGEDDGADADALR